MKQEFFFDFIPLNFRRTRFASSGWGRVGEATANIECYTHSLI